MAQKALSYLQKVAVIEAAREAPERARKMAEKVKEKLARGVFDDELQRYVQVLKQYKGVVPPLCGSTWTDWSEVGECQVCAAPVDIAEKGLHCTNGGHRICWGCMVEKIDWSQIDWVKVAKEDPKRLALLEEVACEPCEEDAAGQQGGRGEDPEPADLKED